MRKIIESFFQAVDKVNVSTVFSFVGKYDKIFKTKRRLFNPKLMALFVFFYTQI